MAASGVGVVSRIRSAQQLLATFCAHTTHADVSAAARRKTVLAILDCVGAVLAASGEPAADIPVDVLTALEPPGAASVIGRWDRRLSAPSAALVNGTRAHALDFDDVHYPWYGHPTAVLLPALLALAEHLDASGEDVVTAYAIGLTVGAALGECLNMPHYERGWHATATLGSIAAAGACANLLGLSVEQTAHALGIAASEACGVRQNFGSPVKPLHAGLAARNGVLAALLAQGGLTADTAALDGPLGFARLYGATDNTSSLGDLEAVLGEGVDHAFAGLSVKLYPSCAATHPAIDIVLGLQREHLMAGADIERVDCDVSALLNDILIWSQPRTGLQGKFSLEYSVAVALQDGTAGLAQFSDARASDPRLWTLMERVHKRIDPSVDPRGEFGTRVTVSLRDGRRLTRYAVGARGTPSQPVADREVIAKFTACAETHVTDVHVALEAILGCDSSVHVRQMVRAIRGAGSDAA
ncbi:MAG: MmgE/PrpD family protein [Chloroflexota bacterium]